MSLLRKPEQGNNLPANFKLPNIDMSNPEQNKFWKTAWLAIGAMLQEADEKKENLNPLQAFKRSVHHFQILQNQLPDGTNTGSQSAIGRGEE